MDMLANVLRWRENAFRRVRVEPSSWVIDTHEKGLHSEILSRQNRQICWRNHGEMYTQDGVYIPPSARDATFASETLRKPKGLVDAARLRNGHALDTPGGAERRAHRLGRVAVAVHQPLRRRGTGRAQPAIVGRRRTSGRRPAHRHTTRSSATTATPRARDAHDGDSHRVVAVRRMALHRLRHSSGARQIQRHLGSDACRATRADRLHHPRRFPLARGPRSARRASSWRAHRLHVCVAHLLAETGCATTL